jgi:hypothetical protein
MNKLISTGNEQVIDVAEFIACLERRGGRLGHALLCILASFREPAAGGLGSRARDRTKIGVAVIVRCSLVVPRSRLDNVNNRLFCASIETRFRSTCH